MENKRQTKPKGSTVHSGKRESFQVVGDSGGSISHRLRASQLLPSVSDDATVIYSHKNGEFVSTKYGSSYKGSDKTAPGSSLCSQGQNPCEDISPVVTGIRVNACNGGTRMKLNIATQTNRLMRSRSRAVQCSGFSEAETERSKSSSISGWCHKADHYEILQNDFKMSDKASDRIEGWFTCVDVLERLLYHSTERDVLLDFKVTTVNVLLSHRCTFFKASKCDY